MTEPELLALLKALAPVIEKRIFTHVSPVAEQLKDVSSQLANARLQIETLEQANSGLCDSYKGIWQPGTYTRNAVVTMRGSLWLCFRETQAKPGAGDDWRLIVKAGRDAPDVPKQ
jgi:hypothetical protein